MVPPGSTGWPPKPSKTFASRGKGVTALKAKLLLLIALVCGIVLALQGLIDSELLYGLQDGGGVTRIFWTR